MGGKAKDDTLARNKDNYRERKYNVADRVIEARAKIDAKRKKRAIESLYSFISTYGPGAICEYAPPPEMRELLDDMERCADSSAGRYQIMMSRGFGKTTFVSGLALYRLCKGLTHFVEIIAATDGKAGDIFDTVMQIFTSSPFAEDYPEVSVPYGESGGNSIKMMRMKWDDKRLGMEKSKGRFILPTVPDSVISGAKIVIKSFTAKDLRGLNIHSERPDFILLDDIQTDEMAANPEQISKAVKKINGTIRGQFAHHKTGTMIMTSTPIFPGDVSERLKDDPGWITKTYPMMRAMPTNKELWEKYAEVYREEVAATAIGKKANVTAKDFYKANRAALDEGADPFSPHAFIRGREISAVQHAMNIIFGTTDGEEVFETEYQMKPRRSQSVYDLSYKTVLAAANGVPQMRVPDKCLRLVAAIDVMKNAGLRWTVMAFGPDRVAAVINYGRYPADGEPLFDTRDQFAIKQSKVAAAVDELVETLEAAVFTSEDGARRFKIGAVGIDSGWMNRVIVSYCAGSGRRVAMRGVSFNSFAPRTKTGQLANGVIDATDWCYERQVSYGTFLGFHSDYWREQAQRAWFNAPLQPSSLSVYGKPETHLQFAQECVADQLIEKDKTRSGADTWKWAVNGANHLGDCVTMCLALAHWKRAYSVGGDIGQGAFSPVSASSRIASRGAVRRPATVCL